MIAGFYDVLGIESLALCATVIIALLGSGWTISEKVDSLIETYEGRVTAFEKEMQSKAQKEIEALYDESNANPGVQSKTQIVAKILQKVFELSSQRYPARNYHNAMW